MAVYDPALMMQGDSWLATAYMVVKTVFAVCLWGMAVTGHLSLRMPIGSACGRSPLASR
ncbi:hypothetical protein SSTU70S_07061 [Stutzerimonas stutzeri]